jgi:hypothetical protein
MSFWKFITFGGGGLSVTWLFTVASRPPSGQFLRAHFGDVIITEVDKVLHRHCGLVSSVLKVFFDILLTLECVWG